MYPHCWAILLLHHPYQINPKPNNFIRMYIHIHIWDNIIYIYDNTSMYIYIYIPWPSEPAKFAGWHLKPRVSKQNPRFFYFHKFQDHAPKCSDFINAVGPPKVLHFCPVYWSSTPKHKPNTQQKHIIFSPVPRGSNPCLYHGCTRVNHGLNMGWTRVRENLVIFKIHEV